jgi:hypothetical protein
MDTWFGFTFLVARGSAVVSDGSTRCSVALDVDDLTQRVHDLHQLAGVGHHLVNWLVCLRVNAWLAVAENGTRTSVLVVDASSIQLLTQDGACEQTWPRSDLVSAQPAGVQRGAFKRPGLRLEFAEHGHPTGGLGLVFLALGGLAPSKKTVAEVQAVLADVPPAHER